MSTRRARIKAVASLSVRRNNAESVRIKVKDNVIEIKDEEVSQDGAPGPTISKQPEPLQIALKTPIISDIKDEELSQDGLSQSVINKQTEPAQIALKAPIIGKNLIEVKDEEKSQDDPSKPIINKQPEPAQLALKTPVINENTFDIKDEEKSQDAPSEAIVNKLPEHAQIPLKTPIINENPFEMKDEEKSQDAPSEAIVNKQPEPAQITLKTSIINENPFEMKDEEKSQDAPSEAIVNKQPEHAQIPLKTPIINENPFEMKDEEKSQDAPSEAIVNKQPEPAQITSKTPVIIENLPSTSSSTTVLRTSILNESTARRRDLAKVSPSPRLHKRRRKSTHSRCETDSDVEIRQTPPPSSHTASSKEHTQRPSVIKTHNMNHEIIDGIVPLKSVAKTKPLELLKDEIITENAEVVFDPIVPLPSPGKVRHKLRPTPRLGNRRSSFQGSASESDDEMRRTFTFNPSRPGLGRQRHDSQNSVASLHLSNKESKRVRNDSVSSIATQSQATTVSPIRSNKRKLIELRTPSLSRRNRLKGKEVAKEKLTMYDLIFYNPLTNPIQPDKDEEEVKKLSVLDGERSTRTASPVDQEEIVDDPKTEDATPAPQIKIGADGKIVLDEGSLVIQETESKRKLEDVVVREGSWSAGNGRYTRTTRSREWSENDTIRFYRALAAVGTDFSVMAHLFPKRTRRELKIKFKKEEKMNGALVDKAMESPVPWDVLNLADEFEKEREDEAKKKEEKKVFYVRQKKETKELKDKLKSQGIKATHLNKTVKIFSVRRDLYGQTPGLDDILKKSKKPPRSKRQSKRSGKTVPPIADPPELDDDDAPLRRKPQTSPLKTVVPENVNPLDAVPPNVENGSLVLLSVDDPNDSRKKIFQTYLAKPEGLLTAVNLPPGLMNSVASYIRKSQASSSRSESPSSVKSQSSTISKSNAR